MTGQILDYNIQDAEGIISGEDGKRYSFTNAEWNTSSSHPEQGIEVDFQIQGETALDVYSIEEPKQDTQTNINIQSVSTSSAAVVSLVFGIIGIFITWWMLGIPSIIAIITGHIAKSNIKASKGLLEGDGLATAGLILGYIMMTIYLLVAFVFVGVLASMGNANY